MLDHEIEQWRQALSLYKQGLDEAVDDLPPQTSLAELPEPVQTKLQQLLDATHTKAGKPITGPLDNLVIQLGITADDPQQEDALDISMAGRRLGDWTIQKPLGRGGMASVYLVEKTGVEFHQKGALKLLSLLSLASEGFKRFIREQQFLAQLQHPNIAMLLDGGVAEDSTPYLVMELVEGLPITEYCQQQALKGEDIAKLLLQLCAAVSHAHSKLILHRDIKPSNVMVTKSGQVKLLDFGIGKLNDDTIESTLSRVYTPKYASPEQKHGDVVTTATDVFGVGTLAGILFQQSADSYLEMHREIASVLAKATHIEPQRRYSSIDNLARDIQNCLENRPISAVPDSRSYRFKKFVRRNRGMVSSGVAIAVITFTALVAVLWQAETARVEAQKANTLSGFMIDLFAEGDLLAGQGPDTPISTLMQEGAERAHTQLAEMPGARSEVLRVIGLAQTEFGEYELAGDNLRAALKSADTPLARAKATGSLGVWYAERAEFSQGIAQLTEALAMMSDELPASNPDRMEVETDLINFLLFTGENQQSIDRADALIKEIGSLDKLADIDHANILRSRAMALTQLDRLDEAEAHLHLAIELTKNLSPAQPALLAAFQNDLGIALAYKGDTAGSAEAFYDSYTTQVSIYGKDHKRTITSGTNLTHMLRSAKQFERGIELGEQLLTTSLERFGEVHRSTVIARFALALVLSDAGLHQQANQQMAISIAAMRQLPEVRSDLANYLSWQGEILIRLAHFEQAIVVLNESEMIRNTEFLEEARRYRVAAQQRLVQAHAALEQCETANTLLTDIRAELIDGNPAQWLTTRIYMLNCNKDQPAKVANLLQEVSKSAGEKSQRDANLQAALQWSEGRFSLQ